MEPNGNTNAATDSDGIAMARAILWISKESPKARMVLAIE
jgi:hypothetical protein